MSLTFPVLLPQAWCSGGGANQGLLNTLGTITNNVLSSPANQPSASLADGFPIDNMSAGGYAPNGGDMNAALYYITLFQAWVNAGQMFPFNSTLATDLGGYPIGTTLMLGTGTQAVMSTAASNSTNPNSSMTGWQYTYGQVVGTGGSVALANALNGSMYYNSADGLTLQGKPGTQYDFSILGANLINNVMTVPTGTVNVNFGGTVTTPALITGATTVGPAGSVFFNSVNGMSVRGDTGSSYDLTLLNPGNSLVMSVPTGTLNANFASHVAAMSLQVTGAGNAAGSLFYDAVAGLVVWAKGGSSYDFEMLNPANSATIMSVPTGTLNTIFNGTVTAPVLQTGASTSGTSGSVFYNSANGMCLYGKTGSGSDMALLGASGLEVMAVPTGTTNTIWFGKQTWTLLANASPALGDVWMDSTQQTLCAEEGASGNPVKVYKSGTLATMKTPGGYSVTCTTAGTFSYDWLPAADFLNTLTLPANFWVVGKSIKIEMWCSFTTSTGIGAPSLYIVVGAPIVAASMGNNLVASTSYSMKVEAAVTCIAVGASGTAKAQGAISFTAYSASTGAALGSSTTGLLSSGFQTTSPSVIDITGGFNNYSGIVVTIGNVLITVLA
jgi:hypothetical protein